jgi:hypothetical protein
MRKFFELEESKEDPTAECPAITRARGNSEKYRIHRFIGPGLVGNGAQTQKIRPPRRYRKGDYFVLYRTEISVRVIQ